MNKKIEVSLANYWNMSNTERAESKGYELTQVEAASAFSGLIRLAGNGKGISIPTLDLAKITQAYLQTEGTEQERIKMVSVSTNTPVEQVTTYLEKSRLILESLLRLLK